MNLKLIKYNEHMAKIESQYRHDHCYLIQLDDKMIGAVWFEEITDTDAKPKIYVVEPECWMEGIYTEIIKRLVEIAFSQMKLNKLRVDTSNAYMRVIRGYMECGFSITRREPETSGPDSFHQGILEMELSVAD